MQFFFELGNRYAASSDWKDFALTKFCLFAMGIIVGTLLPDSCRVYVWCIAGLVFLATYIPLMAKIFRIMKEMKQEK